jgi:2-polyprenyl-3-methyl-5-hydroxy-6-metoxy-1,4-benzoquinol methylase
LIAVTLASGCHKRSATRVAQDEYVLDVAAFTHQAESAVRDQMAKDSAPMRDEWLSWEKQGPMTPERIKEFYKQTPNYIFELGHWHLWLASKRKSDAALIEDMKKLAPKNILDFGGGVGLNSIPLAKAGFDVTLADLDSKTLAFGAFRAQRHHVPLKIWKSDVEPMPPDKTYDMILALDVLEHLPPDELTRDVDQLIQLKHAGTHVIINAPFGRNDIHPMHLDGDDHTKRELERLEHDLPKG